MLLLFLVFLMIKTSRPQLNIRMKSLRDGVDVNLGAEYKFNKALSFWLNINNLGSTQHFNWV